MNNWIRDFVRPKVNAVLRKSVPENLWAKCDSCGQMIFHRELEEAFNVCAACGHHMPLKPVRRFESVFDSGVYQLVKTEPAPSDPLSFRDLKRYTERLRQARSQTGSDDAMQVATGSIGEVETVVAAHDFEFLAGSMGIAVGNATLHAARLAAEKSAPLVIFAAAGGARMQEGILSLMQLPRTTLAVQIVRDAGVPYISVLTHPTTGGVTASYAMLGDIQIAEPNALICFAGPRVIEQTIREKLPEGFQRAEHLLEHGMLDMVVPRMEIRSVLVSLLRMLTRKPPLEAPGNGNGGSNGNSRGNGSSNGNDGANDSEANKTA